MLTRSVLVDLPPQTSCQAHSLPRSNASKSGDLVEIRVDFFCWVFIQQFKAYLWTFMSLEHHLLTLFRGQCKTANTHRDIIGTSDPLDTEDTIVGCPQHGHKQLCNERELMHRWPSGVRNHLPTISEVWDVWLWFDMKRRWLQWMKMDWFVVELVL